MCPRAPRPLGLAQPPTCPHSVRRAMEAQKSDGRGVSTDNHRGATEGDESEPKGRVAARSRGREAEDETEGSE